MKNYSPKITAHCLVCNEERWIWYAIMSVLDYVDEILVWDTGSTDKTVDIIKSMSSKKVKFKEVGAVNPDTLTECRNQMLAENKSNWILLLDGDEIWTKKAIESSRSLINDDTGYLVNSHYNLVGDVYHFQDENAGKYKIKSWTGHINIRLININSVSGLHFTGPYGSEGLVSSDNIRLQEIEDLKAEFIQEKYLHATHLERSTEKGVMMRKQKYKFELGHSLPSNFKYPACFYQPNSLDIPSPWTRRTSFYFFNAIWQSPLKLIKRRIFY